MSGILIIGLTPDGLNVVINLPAQVDDGSGWEHVVFSPEEARALALKLLEKAADCRRADRTFDAAAVDIPHKALYGSARSARYTCLIHNYYGDTPCRECPRAQG